jgi:hypothetical protein
VACDFTRRAEDAGTYCVLDSNGNAKTRAKNAQQVSRPTICVICNGLNTKQQSFCPLVALCLARIKSDFEMNNIRRGDVALLHALWLGEITIRQAQAIPLNIIFKPEELFPGRSKRERLLDLRFYTTGHSEKLIFVGTRGGVTVAGVAVTPLLRFS